MKKIPALFILLAVIAATIATAQKTVTIHGKVKGDTKGYNYIYFYSQEISKDSVAIQNGEFKIDLQFNGRMAPVLYTQFGFSYARSYRPMPLLIDEPGTIEIEMDIEKGLYGAKITGMETTELYYSFLNHQDAANKQISEGLIKMYGKSWVQNNDPLAKELFASRDSLNKLIMGKMVTDFVLSNKDLNIAPYILSNYGRTALIMEDLEKTLNLLPENTKKTADGAKLAAYITGIKTTKIGSTPKNFILNDEKGNSFSFDKYKGKYVWVDFWASWCGPCKNAFPRMRELYTEYKDRNLEILGISTDTKKEPWLNALETIKNPWKQVWDDKNIMSEFAVNAFPTSFLIGSDGTILAKEVGFNPNEKGPIVKKLEELLGPTKIDFATPAKN